MNPETGRTILAGYFKDSGDAKKSVEQLRQAGFAQIGIASHDAKNERKLAEATQTRAGLAVGSGPDGELEQAFGESDYANRKDAHDAMLAARVPEEQARWFDDRMEQGGYLITVQAPADRASEARRTLQSCGGEIGPESGTAVPAATAPAPTSPIPGAARAEAESEGEQIIRLHGELLRVHKERVARGEVRLRKRVVTEPQTVEVPVSREEVVIEHRTPTQGAAATGEGDERGQIRVPISEERVEVEKEPVVTDEIAVGKRTVEGTQRVEGEVRREELEVEDEGNLTPEQLAELRRRPRRAA